VIILRAPAKINLYLHVLGRRDDGYHEVVTRMQKIDLFDSIGLELLPGPGVVFSCDEPSLPTDDNNLAIRAARLFLDAVDTGGSRGIGLSLAKRIPVAAGLGGGSSDAGTVLRGMNGLFDNLLPEPELLGLAQHLGADVPFFACGARNAVGTGRGDELIPARELSGKWYIIVNPGFGVSTKWVFDNYALTSSQKNSRLRGSQIWKHEGFSPEDAHNDLEQVTMARYPVLGEIKSALLDAGAEAALMSGSGPTLFGIFCETTNDEASLGSLRHRLAEQFGKAWLIRAYTGA
jgi:4-diphosphocytidyl-2-C-methyl-D-erythritol kinase